MLNYSTLTNQASLENVDSIQVKTLTTEELYVQGVSKNQPLVSNSVGKITTAPLTDGQLIIGNTSTSSYNASALTSSTNISITNGSGSISIATTMLPTFTRVQTSNTYTVDSTMTTAAIQAIISNVAYNVIEFSPGTYTMTSYLNVNRSDLVIHGNKAILKIGKYINTPVVFIGDMTTNPPTIRYENISIYDLHVVGNKGFQTSETCYTKTWIYNNGIGMNLVSNINIVGCRLDDCRSGGMTITYQSSYVNVQNCFSTLNYFDAFTAYGSTNITFQGCQAYNHSNGAGFSFDISCQYVSLTNNVCTGNKLALFARYCNDINLTGNVFSGNTQQGMFIAGNYEGTNIGPNKRWVISNNTINNNGLQGVYLQSCQYFTVSGNTICNNGTGLQVGCDNDPVGLSSYNSFSNNIISSNTTYGFFDDSSNDTAVSNLLTLNIVKSNTTNNYSGNLTSYSITDTPNSLYSISTITATTSSTSYVSTGFSITITPRYQTSKIKITFSGQISYSGSDFGLFTLYRNSTNLCGTTGFIVQLQNTDACASYTFVDPPYLLTPVVYTIYQKVNASGSVVFNNSGVLSSLIAEEINI